jgi:hypothetical protein
MDFIRKTCNNIRIEVNRTAVRLFSDFENASLLYLKDTIDPFTSYGSPTKGRVSPWILIVCDQTLKYTPSQPSREPEYSNPLPRRYDGVNN